MIIRDRTVAFFVKDKEVLLGLKKRGHGQGKWNGFGGKPDAGESIESAMIRECLEEVTLKPLIYKKVAEIDFIGGSDLKESPTKAHCYIVSSWDGSPLETEEMRPKWFNFENIPYTKMWPSDELWVPLVISNKPFKATIYFDKEDRLISHDINRIPRTKWNIG